MYKQYEDDPSVPVPKRTAMRHSSARQGLFISTPPCSTDKDKSGSETCIESDNTHGFCDQQHEEFSSSDFESDYSDESSEVASSESDSSESDLDSELSDNVEDEISSGGPEIVYSEMELNAICLVSYFLRHNSSGIAIQDLLNLLRVLCPDSSQFRDITYEKVMLLAGNTCTNCKTIDYCSICGQRFPENADLFRCDTVGCAGLRYKGKLHAQQSTSRQPKNSFVLADVKKQLQFIFERKGSWTSIQNTKKKIGQNIAHTEISDICDGQFYRTLCQPGQFLNDSNNISALFNTDGIPLYNSSNVKLWPVFLAINELPPSSRFSRENMVLAAIWQGKDKPPFSQYMCAFGEQMCKLYVDGMNIKPFGTNASLDVRLAVFVGTMDLQAKAYVLNMTMHNGEYGCSACEESGTSVRQGKGYARFYPYRSLNDRPVMRESDNVKYEKGPNATSTRRIKGVCGITGLAAMEWFDVVIGVVPDYMHCVLLGVMKAIMYKLFSPTNSDKPYFIGKDIKKISKRLNGICPPDFIERMPRELEKNYNHFKATELQTFLLFYSLPCLNGYLDDIYLKHLAQLSEGIYLLLGDTITEYDLLKAERLLDSFYEQFPNLYGQGSCGLNVHNIGAHMVFFVRMWGPLWSWSCFAFEDWNAALLQSVHGTGDVTKQCLRMIELQLKMNCFNTDSIAHGETRSYIIKMKKRSKTWSVTPYNERVATAGALKPFTNVDEDEISFILKETGCDSILSFKKALRVQVDNQKLYAEEYNRMKKRICNVVRCKNGQLRQIKYFLICTKLNSVLAFAEKIEIHHESFICVEDSHHIIRVNEASGKDIFPVENISEKVFFMKVDGFNYVACMPNSLGHSIFK